MYHPMASQGDINLINTATWLYFSLWFPSLVILPCLCDFCGVQIPPLSISFRRWNLRFDKRLNYTKYSLVISTKTVHSSDRKMWLRICKEWVISRSDRLILEQWYDERYFFVQTDEEETPTNIDVLREHSWSREGK